MERRIFVCDFCGVQQETTNHWFSIGITWESTPNGAATLTLAKLESPHTAHADELLHLCGEQCALRKVSDFIAMSLTEIFYNEAREVADSIPAESSNA